jgi:hypothetical protein
MAAPFVPTYAASVSSTTVQVDVQDAGGVVRSRTLHTYLGNASNLQPYALESGIPGSAYPAAGDGKESESDAVALETGVTQRQVKSLWGARTCNSETCFDLNVCQTSATLSENANTITSGDLRLYDQYSNLTERYEFDYGAAPAQGLTCPVPAPAQPACQSFGGYKRCTHQEFSAGYDQPSTNSNLTLGLVNSNNHIRNLPTTTQIYDAGVNVNSRTDYLYDGGAVQNNAGIVNQLAAYGTGFTLGRGNLTTARKYFGSTQAIDFRTDFDIAGNAVKSYDGLGRATSLTYSSPDYGFVTQVCKAVTEAGTAQNRCFTQSSDYAPSADAGGYVGVGGGQLTSRTDLNAVATRFAYNDALDRVTTATRASGTSVQNQTAFTYTNSNTVITANKDKDTFLDGLLASRTFLDGLGREVEARQFEDGKLRRIARRHRTSAYRALS